MLISHNIINFFLKNDKFIRVKIIKVVKVIKFDRAKVIKIRDKVRPSVIKIVSVCLCI